MNQDATFKDALASGAMAEPRILADGIAFPECGRASTS